VKGDNTRAVQTRTVPGVLSSSVKPTEGMSFGSTRKQRAREKRYGSRFPAESLGRVSYLHNSRGVKRSAARITSTQSLRAASRRHGINRDAGEQEPGGRLVELTARSRQNVKRVHPVRPGKKRSGSLHQWRQAASVHTFFVKCQPLESMFAGTGQDAAMQS
jgi:hypothetical protein